MKYFVQFLNPIYEVKEVHKQSFNSLKQAMQFIFQIDDRMLKRIQIRRNDGKLYFVLTNDKLVVAYNDLGCYKIER